MDSDHLPKSASSACGQVRSSASLTEIKFIIKTSILPPTPSACPSVKRIQKFLQNGSDSSFEQSMEFKPINAIQSQSSSFKRYSSLRRFSEKFVDKSSSSSSSTDRLQYVIDNDDGLSNGEDNERLDMNINGSIAARLTHSASRCEVEKILKKPKLTHENSTSPKCTLFKSSSATNLPEQKSGFLGIRSLSLTPSPSLFRKSYSCRNRLGSSFVQEKLVVPTIMITSTPIKDSTSSLDDPDLEQHSHLLCPSALSKENMQIFETECEMQDVAEDANDRDEEDMEFSFICEPAESECGDPLNEMMETSVTSSSSTSSSSGEFFQPPLEPDFLAEPSHSVNTMTKDAALLKRWCQSGPPNNCQLLLSGSGREADVTAYDDAKVGPLVKDPRHSQHNNSNGRSDSSSSNNKENEFLAPDKKCLTSKRVKSATVRVLHSLTAKSLADDLIENCGDFPRPPPLPNTSATKNSPFRRYGQISSSFRSQLTATEAKKMLTSGTSAPGQPSKFPARPRSFASSEGDVYYKSDCMPPPPEPSPRKTTSSAGGTKEESGKMTRVADWSTSFEILLGDTYGVHAFAEFLRKEFSAENIYFWTACERYKQLTSENDRYREAQQILERHLENGAPEPVNIDSKATSKTLEQLKLANPDLFDAAQKQIFNLMKFDSYARFIKSDIYKQCLECQMKKLPPPYPENRVLDVALSCCTTSTSHALQGVQGANGSSPVKLKKSLSNAEDRRRKSLLPWHRKTRSKSKDRNEEKRAAAAAESNHQTNSVYSSRSSLSSFDAVLSAESTENQRSQLCRVILPNGATTIVQTRPTETIRELVVRLLEKRGLSYTCFEVYVSDSNKPCDLEGMSTRIAGKQVNIEQRVTFKLDLPNKKVISVKSKPEKVLEEVLRPILHKYHYSLDEVHVHLRDTPPGRTPHVTLVKWMVTEVDGRRLIILDRNEDPPKSTLHEITNRVFNEIMPEHQLEGGGVVSVKKLADYMNCRFAGQQMVEGCLPRKEGSIDEESDQAKRSVIAKWTAGAKLLQSPTVASFEGPGRHVHTPSSRDPLRPSHQVNFDLPAFLKNDVVNANERPTPAPRLSIAKSSPQTSSSSINNSQDSGILSNRSAVSTGTSSSSTHGDHLLTQPDSNELDTHPPEHTPPSHCSANEMDQLKSPPPPLPPKPKVLPIRGPNWGGQSTKHIFLDQPTSSSFV